MTTAEDPFSELVDADIPRVDLVGKAANGMRFLIAKSAAGGVPGGLLDPDFVRGLIAKSAPETPLETVTMSGSPAAMAALLIHGAPVRKTSPEENTVSKATTDLDPTTVLADPDIEAPGDVADPGSPAWEAVDAATARKWTSILSRACNALSVMAEREMLESVAGDTGDIGAVFELEDAKCAIDFAISVLAPFAVGEQAEADLGTEALEAVGKALADFDASPLDLLEAMAPIAKAGRTLSASNEASIRGAVDALQKVLSSLPAAVDESGQPVAKKETTMTTAAAPGTAIPAVPTVVEAETPGAAVVAKAKGDPQVAVYTAEGVLVGTVDQSDITAIATAEAPADKADDPADAPVVAAGEDAAVVPGTSTVASPAPDEEMVQKAQQADIRRLLTESLTPIAEGLAQYAQLADVVKGLQEQVTHLAQSPDDRKSPLFNGAVGVAAAPRVEDGLAPLRKAVEAAATPAEREAAESSLGLAMIHERFTRR